MESLNWLVVWFNVRLSDTTSSPIGKIVRCLRAEVPRYFFTPTSLSLCLFYLLPFTSSLLCLITINWTYHIDLPFLKDVNAEIKSFGDIWDAGCPPPLQNARLIIMEAMEIEGIRSQNVLTGYSYMEATDKFYGLGSWNKHHALSVCTVRPLSAMICSSSRDPLNYSAWCLQQLGRSCIFF